MNNGLLYLGGLLALVLAALFGVPYFIDWNGYRGVFEEEASKVLGRDVRVGGGVNVRFLPTPYVRFEKIRIADPKGQTGEPFLRAESFTMRLAVSPLLRGAFEANDIELTKPVLSLVSDGEGGGNWSSLQLKPGSLPFVPKDVALHAVRISDGALLIHGPSGGLASRVDAIRGELAADTLSGPFKFRGEAKVSGEMRDLKFATMAAAPAGKVQFKSSMVGLESRNAYTIDGLIEDFTGKPRISGELTGKLTLQDPNTQAAPGANPKSSDENTQPVFNIKSQIKADARGATFEVVELDLDGAAEPQLITGKASATWGDTPRFETTLHAKWLDLDVISAPKGQTASLARLQETGVALLNTLGGEAGAGAARIEIEQVKVGGEQGGALKIDAERNGRVVVLRELRAGLPGGARFELSGSIADQGGILTLEGDGAIRGINLARFQSWAQKSGATIDLKAEGPFWVAGHVTASESGFRLSRAKAEIAGEAMSGDIAIEAKERRTIAIHVEAPKLDTAMFFPAEAQRVSHTLKRGLGISATGGDAGPGSDGSQTDFTLHIAATELRHDGALYRDVDARLALAGPELRIQSARFLTQAGVKVNVSGGINTSAAAPKGTLSYDVDAPAREALQEAASLSGLAHILPQQRIASMSSARLSGLIRLGHRVPTAADVSFDGIVDGARVSGEAAFDSGLRSWRTAPSRITATATTQNAPALLAAFGVPGVSLKGIEARPAEATLAIAGLLAEGAQSYGAIKADGLDVTLTGKLRNGAGGAYAFKGQAAVAAREAREALALAGIAVPAGLSDSKLEGNVEIAAENGVVKLKSSRLTAGVSTLGGEVELADGGDAALKVTADIEVDRVVVAGLLGWLGDRERPASDKDAPVAYSIWPEAPFNLDALTNVNGEVRLKAGVFELTEGLAVRESNARVTFSPGKLTLAELRGKAAGGTLETTAEIEKAPGGAALTGKMRVKADLAKITNAASGEAEVTFTANGRGVSAAGLVGSLAGSGSITLKEARHPGAAPALVADAGDAILTGRLENETEVLESALIQALDNSGIVAGSRTVPFTVAGGDVKIDAMVLPAAQGEARIATIVSLTSLAVDSVWNITAFASPSPPPPEALPDWKPAPKGPLPAVTFVYSGSLGDLAQLQVRVDAKDLQRELSVRQMERKLEELDAVRKRDDERARQEIERRKAMEAERARIAAEAAAAAAAAKAQSQQRANQPAPMPPVVPENNAGATTNDGYVPQGAAPPPPPSAAGANASAPPAASQPPAQPASDAAANAETEQQTNQVDGASQGTDASARPASATAPRPQPATRPQQRRRTTSDELNKAFGGWP